MRFKLLIVALVLSNSLVFAQGPYAPAAGEPGSMAIHKDSSIISGWAKECFVNRGFINISDTNLTYTQGAITSNHAFFGIDTVAIGYPENGMNYVSLGDGGYAILEFDKPITNGEGHDFAVYENCFKASSPPQLYFIELAFVEVSSDGQNFVRFPSFSETYDSVQMGAYGQIDPSNIHNLAGKYEVNYGTPFDLDEITDTSLLNMDSITHVKIIDVVGTINPAYCSYDSEGNIINDPWPTPFWSCGFDLNAVAVINYKETEGIESLNSKNQFLVYPNPVKAGENINISLDIKQDISLYNSNGSLIYKMPKAFSSIKIPENLSPGLYFFKTNTYATKLIIE